ncbi:MAG: hypothetical protein KDJ45_05230 [Hyphomicrobiaceae bacterium]|nr:hypothetical protein [Hyphomicrobiaceae bacterium]MCC0009640.1 hypothetical protein [Hyphomicrobiaceae bacterium]
MSSIADKIMKRVRRHGRGVRVYTPKDFLDLVARSGTRAAVDQALARLARAGTLRRVGRGLYDWPRYSKVLDAPAPTNIDAVVDAVARRANITVRRSNLAAANALGLTHAVPTQPDYVADRSLNDVIISGRKLRFRDAGTMVRPWLDTPAAPLVQAMVWLHDGPGVTDAAIQAMCSHASDDAKRALRKDLSRLPAWAIPIAHRVTANHAINGA